jgi:putative endonuclease
LRLHAGVAARRRAGKNGRLARRRRGCPPKEGARKLFTMHVVYVLKSLKKKYFYVGMTNNIERRLIQHNTGQSSSTEPYRPLVLVLKETYDSRQKARDREKYLKSGVGREYLKRVIK